MNKNYYIDDKSDAKDPLRKKEDDAEGEPLQK